MPSTKDPRKITTADGRSEHLRDCTLSEIQAIAGRSKPSSLSQRRDGRGKPPPSRRRDDRGRRSVGVRPRGSEGAALRAGVQAAPHERCRRPPACHAFGVSHRSGSSPSSTRRRVISSCGNAMRSQRSSKHSSIKSFVHGFKPSQTTSVARCFGSAGWNVGGHEILPIGGHRNSPLVAAVSPHAWPRFLPTVLS